jgi:hypothetical protein
MSKIYNIDLCEREMEVIIDALKFNIISSFSIRDENTMRYCHTSGSELLYKAIHSGLTDYIGELKGCKYKLEEVLPNE